MTPQGSGLPRVASDSPAAVLLVDAVGQVVSGNALARQLAQGTGVCGDVRAWCAAAGLQDLAGSDLAGAELAGAELAGTGRAGAVLAGGTVPLITHTSRRLTARPPGPGPRIPLYAVAQPAHEGHTLVLLLPLRDVTGGSGEGVLTTGRSYLLSDTRRPDLPVVWVDASFETLTGYAPADVVGGSARVLLGPATDLEQVDRLRTELLEGRDATGVILHYRKDGSAFWDRISVSPLLDGQGAVTHVVAVQADITERVEAERARDHALEAERAARGEAEAAHERAELLSQRMSLVAEATGLLGATLDVDESLERLARLVVPRLADWVAIILADQQGRLSSRAFVRHRDGHHELLARYRDLVPAGVAPGSPLHALLAGAQPRLYARYEAPDPADVAPSERPIQQISMALGARSMIFVPLTARAGVVGAMMLVQGPSEREFDEADLALAEDLGRRAGLAIDNARLYTSEHATALTLQRSLLPTLPQVPGLALAAEYLPAFSSHRGQVGGDWWDVFALPDGATALAVGDVMGHDITAAAAMGQLRSVLRTCAWNGDDPATVVDRMDRLVQGFDMAQLATCIYARLEPADPAGGRRRSPRLVWSNAGHLPPVVLLPDGTASLLTGVGGVPVGVPADEARAQHSISLPVGTTLLLYTDGLVETRCGDIDSDLEQLLGRVRTHSPADGPVALLDTLLKGQTELNDDVALLAVQVL